MEQTVDIVYVEDDAADADFAESALKETVSKDINLRIRIIDDGEAAIKFLGLTDAQQATNPPDLILLDLNLPRVHGTELLKMIKNSPHLKHVPVLILSTSDHKRDVEQSYQLGAEAYFAKPSSYEEYKDIFKTICTKWLKP
jgi:CheY-like chemotaxis protein